MLNPTGYHVLVLPDVTEEKTESGIILARDTIEANKDTTVTGTLYKVGVTAWRGFDDGTPWASEGDRVVYAKYAGKRITDPDSGIEYLLMSDSDIVCRIV